MRVDLVSGLSPLQRLVGGLMRAVIGAFPGPIQVFSYRRRYFGKHAAPLFHAAMRGPSSWTVAERELFAAFVSKKNACAY
ncbi:carboxymuconolactone decarboxylase family protein [Paraliomyxa miuraensis]|uniref:hypothetical protein n=1 Tax=Paraliomyxa miuraensis TaxID=376150 RepID=UPI00224CDC13|nr:hypothetical protein [Paraliomyxa miuraensis]MCX4241325.1 hypothetical protein [Paraliomyxa miuraensis]